MSGAPFTNRRGKRLDVTDEEITQIDVESDAAPMTTQPSAKQRPDKPRRDRKRVRTIILVIVGILLLSALVTVSFIFLTADAARREYQRQESSIRGRVQEVAGQPFGAETSAVEVLDQLTQQLAAIEDCTVDGPQAIIDRYQPAVEAREACQAVAAQHAAVETALSQLGEAVVYLERQYEILSPALARPADGTFAEIPSMDQSWSGAYTELGTLTPPTPMSDAHHALIGRVKAVSDAWKELRAAHNGQQADAFKAAESKLAQAYEALRSSGNDFAKPLEQLQDELSSVVAQLAP